MKEKKFTITATILTIICLSVIVELGLRLYEKVLEDKREVRLMQGDDELGWRMLPNVNVVRQIDGVRVLIKTNSMGWAYPESHGFSGRMKESTSKRYKIMTIGDSYTFGAFTSEGFYNAYPNLIQSNLSKKGYYVEVVNFGVGGYGFDNYEAVVKKYVKQVKPNLIIIGAFNGNDFSDTYYGMNSYKVKDGVAVRTNKEKDEQLKGHIAKRKFREILNDIFATYRFFRPTFKRIAVRLGLIKDENYFDKFQIDLKQIDFKSYSVWSKINYTKEQQNAVSKSLIYLDSIKRLVRYYGSVFLVVTIPYAGQIYNRFAANGSHDIKFPQEYIKDFCYKNNVHYLDLLPGFRNSNNIKYYWSSDPHFNDLGHKKAAQMITEYIISAGLISNRK